MISHDIRALQNGKDGVHDEHDLEPTSHECPCNIISIKTLGSL